MPEQLALLSVNELPVSFAEHQGELLVRESRRARRLFLHVVPPLGIELVVPSGTRPREVEAFVTRHRAWIEAARNEIEHRYEGERSLRPSSIELLATGLQVRPLYTHACGRRAPFERAGSNLTIRCRREDLADSGAILRRWLLSEAKEALPRWLMREARGVGRSPTRIQVRLQKTRWGSCSANGTISLNASLMLLEPALVRYLLIHELVHLVHLRHSRRYWNRVERHEPRYRALDAELGAAWTRIPYWVVAP
jgi:predicted metal-dependent hydrolase